MTSCITLGISLIIFDDHVVLCMQWKHIVSNFEQHLVYTIETTLKNRCMSCIFLAVLYSVVSRSCLTHWGRVTHICVGKLIITGSDNGLSPDRRQAIIWTNARVLPIWPLGKNTAIFIDENARETVVCEMASILSRPQCVNSVGPSDASYASVN